MSLQGPQPTVPRPIFLRLIGRCTAEQQEALRLLRNHPAIRGAMYTDHIISQEEHARWVAGLSGDDRRLVFVALSPEGEVLDELNMTKMCCRRHFLTHVDIE